MHVRAMESLAQDLKARLAAGRLAYTGHVELTDGAIVEFERMVRIVLFDFERMARRSASFGSSDDEAQRIYDDLVRLHALAHASS